MPLEKNCYAPFKELINKLNTSSPHIPVTCIIADGLFGFAGRVARDLGIQEIQFWTASACGFVGYLHYDELVKRGILPFQGKQTSSLHLFIFYYVTSYIQINTSNQYNKKITYHKN